METALSRDVRFLMRYAVVATTLALLAFLMAFHRLQQRASFTEIDVERINIVEHDGKLRMVISNQARQHPGIVNGKVIPRSGPRPPGIIFLNHLGDEMGGLIFGENGGIGHFGSLTFDKVRGDQTIGFRHMESDNGAYSTGLEMAAAQYSRRCSPCKIPRDSSNVGHGSAPSSYSSSSRCRPADHSASLYRQRTRQHQPARAF